MGDVLAVRGSIARGEDSSGYLEEVTELWIDEEVRPVSLGTTGGTGRGEAFPADARVGPADDGKDILHEEASLRFPAMAARMIQAFTKRRSLRSCLSLLHLAL